MPRLTLALLALLWCACSEESPAPRDTEHESASRPIVPDASPQSAAVDLTDLLTGKLLTLQDGTLQPMADPPSPTDYYLFYHTASWCTPCKAVIPSLMRFAEMYGEIYAGRFTVVVVAYDKEQPVLQRYAQEYGLDLPYLTLTARDTFLQHLPLPMTMLPSMQITDQQGRILKSSFDASGAYHGVEIPMNYLRQQLTQ